MQIKIDVFPEKFLSFSELSKMSTHSLLDICASFITFEGIDKKNKGKFPEELENLLEVFRNAGDGFCVNIFLPRDEEAFQLMEDEVNDLVFYKLREELEKCTPQENTAEKTLSALELVKERHGTIFSEVLNNEFPKEKRAYSWIKNKNARKRLLAL